jgi:hypothetical protein
VTASDPVPPTCADGSFPYTPEGETFVCQDGSMPTCADGTAVTLSPDGSTLVCGGSEEVETES